MPMAPSKLFFAPHLWHACTKNDWKSCDQGVNCYSYALNHPSNYWSVPGLGYMKSCPQLFFDRFNQYFKNFSLTEYRKSMIEGAIADGLVPVTDAENREGYYIVALFFNDNPYNFDFHWYRKDDDGTWSHKDGWMDATKEDMNGNIILDPRDDKHAVHAIFGSFFLVPRGGIQLTKSFPLMSD